MKTREGLISFKGYLGQKDFHNTGKPPYTIKAADLDENFQRLVVRIQDFPAGSITYLSDGQHIPSIAVDLIVNGVFTQYLMVGIPAPK